MNSEDARGSRSGLSAAAGVVAMLATASFDADDNTITVQCFDYHERDINKYSADIIAMRVGQRHVQ